MNRLLCYAHFDGDGEVKPFVKHAVRSMLSLCPTVFFVSNSPISDDDMAELTALCSHVQVNENIGYDFGMWKTALQRVDFRDYDEIVLMNSSIYGPISPLAPLFEEMGKRDCDFWGITECHLIQHHIQSYFLVFKKQVVDSPQFAEFWHSVLPYRDKHQIILNYEVGLTTWLCESGFRPDAYCSLFRLFVHLWKTGNSVKLPKTNASVKYPVELMDLGNPFLKVEPVRTGAITSVMVAGHLAEHHYPADDITVHDKQRRQNADDCPVCGGSGRPTPNKIKNRVNLRDKGRYEYYRCRDSACGMLWLSSAPDDAALLSIANGYGSYHDLKYGLELQKRSWAASALISLLNAAVGLAGVPAKRQAVFMHGLDRISPGKIVEVNCGRGDRLRALKAIGWNVVGVNALAETELVKELERDGIEVIRKDLGSIDFPAEQFDVVLLSDVIGHVRYPKTLLTQCLGLLKPGGTIHISTPNADAFTRTLFGRYWSGWDAPRHLHIFREAALRSLVSSAGFNNVSVSNLSCNAEIFAMHSLDMAITKWSYPLSEPRIGKEALPLCIQLVCSFVTSVATGWGEELFVVASKKG